MVSKVDRSFDATANETRIVLVSYQDLKGMILWVQTKLELKKQ